MKSDDTSGYGADLSSGRKVGRKTSPIRWHETLSGSRFYMASPAEFDRPTITGYFPLSGERGAEEIIGSRERKQAESKLDVQ